MIESRHLLHERGPGAAAAIGFSRAHRMAALWLVFAAGPVSAANPVVSDILPRGASRGTEVELRILGQRIGDAADLYFDKPGIELISLEAIGAGEVRVRVRVAPDAPLGPRAAYLRTRTGVSKMKLFSIGALAEISEPEPNHDRAEAPLIQINTTVNGLITNEDLDHFGFDLEAGQRVNFEVEGLRLADTLFDPMIVLFDPTGREVAAADDTSLLLQDCAISFTAAVAGRHVIQVRESSFGGSGNSYYRLHLGTFPRPVAVFPAGGPLGETIDLRWIGDAKMPSGPLVIPISATDGLYPETDGMIAPSPVPFRVNDLVNALESEPNNDRDQATTSTLPGALNGILQNDGDVDWFFFEATKGQRFHLELYGRRLRSPIDSVLSVHRADGGEISANDDSRGPDSYIDFTVPDDGRYYVQIRDHLMRGGEGYVYRLEMAPLVAQLRHNVRALEGRMAVPMGNRVATIIGISGGGFSGPVVIERDTLPEGLELLAGEITPGGETPVLFTAERATTVTGRLADIVVRPVEGSTDLTGRMRPGIPLVKYINDSPFYVVEQQGLSIAVTEPIPFKIEVAEPKVPLVRDGRMNLLVTIDRAEGYPHAIDLSMLWKPLGLGAATPKIEAGRTTATLEINAAGNAQIGEFKLAVIARGQVDAGGAAQFAVSSQLFTLRIAEPWLNLAFEKVRTDQGTQAELTAKSEAKYDFPEGALLELLGLPNKVTADALHIDKSATEIKYVVDVPADAPVGKFNPFVRATMFESGEAVVQHIGGIELRVDKPLPPPKPTPTPTPTPVPVQGEPTPEPTPTPTPVPDTRPKRGDRTRATGTFPFRP